MMFGPRGPGLYILDGHRAVRCADLTKWGTWMQTEERRVASDEFENLWISTVFLGINYNFFGNGPPLLFETLVFVDGEGSGTLLRYSTWEEAETGHRWAVNEARMHLDRAGEKTTSLINHLIKLKQET